jgi:hypothetical protein
MEDERRGLVLHHHFQHIQVHPHHPHHVGFRECMLTLPPQLHSKHQPGIHLDNIGYVSKRKEYRTIIYLSSEKSETSALHS